MVMTTVDTRKSTVTSFWQASSPDMQSFSPSVVINGDLATEQSMSKLTGPFAMYVEEPEKPED